MKFRLLVGRHLDAHPRGLTEKINVVEQNGQTRVIERPISVGYAADIRANPPVTPVFESETDLCAKFNSPGYPPKFERVPDSTPCVYDADENFQVVKDQVKGKPQMAGASK